MKEEYNNEETKDIPKEDEVWDYTAGERKADRITLTEKAKQLIKKDIDRGREPRSMEDALEDADELSKNDITGQKSIAHYNEQLDNVRKGVVDDQHVQQFHKHGDEIVYSLGFKDENGMQQYVEAQADINDMGAFNETEGFGHERTNFMNKDMQAVIQNELEAIDKVKNAKTKEEKIRAFYETISNIHDVVNRIQIKIPNTDNTVKLAMSFGVSTNPSAAEDVLNTGKEKIGKNSIIIDNELKKYKLDNKVGEDRTEEYWNAGLRSKKLEAANAERERKKADIRTPKRGGDAGYTESIRGSKEGDREGKGGEGILPANEADQGVEYTPKAVDKQGKESTPKRETDRRGFRDQTVAVGGKEKQLLDKKKISGKSREYIDKMEAQQKKVSYKFKAKMSDIRDFLSSKILLQDAPLIRRIIKAVGGEELERAKRRIPGAGAIAKMRLDAAKSRVFKNIANNEIKDFGWFMNAKRTIEVEKIGIKKAAQEMYDSTVKKLENKEKRAAKSVEFLNSVLKEVGLENISQKTLDEIQEKIQNAEATKEGLKKSKDLTVDDFIPLVKSSAIKSPVSAEQAQSFLDDLKKFSPDEYRRFEKASERFSEVADENLQKLQDAGIITKKEHDLKNPIRGKGVVPGRLFPQWNYSQQRSGLP